MNVYVVKGSEDGYCGTFGSRKRAIAYGVEYILNGFGEAERERIRGMIESREYDHAIYLDGPDRVSVEIYKDKVQ